MVRAKPPIKDREKLVARLRDIYKTDNVALLFFINNYYTEDISVVLHSGSVDKQVEFGVVSYKEPAVIAHEFLHLFGAIDLYKTPWDTKRAMQRKKDWAMKEFPNEVMAFTYRQLDSLDVGQLTRYLIGWEKSLDETSRVKLLGKRIHPVRY